MIRSDVTLAAVLALLSPLLGCSSDADDVPWQSSSGGQAGSSAAGAGQAGTAPQGGQAGVGGTGGNTGGQAGGQSTCSEQNAHVQVTSPADNSTVKSPVTVEMKGACATSAGISYDGTQDPTFIWNPQQQSTATWTHDFTPGSHQVTVHAQYASNALTPVVVHFTVQAPSTDVCSGVDTTKFIEPSVCDGPSGHTSKEIPANNVFSTSWFGCYRKTDGTIYKDPYDNCEFACGNKGMCDASDSGPECEAKLKWFSADADRFGCGGRIMLTNCENGKSVVLVALDRGPNCKTVEQTYHAPVLDMSHDAMMYLFNKAHGGGDLAGVVVQEVDSNTPLGPVN